MRKLKSCGVIVFRAQDQEFLILRHTRRCDLPKGHIKKGETDLECALRELQEETGFTSQDIVLDMNFRYEAKYYPKYKKFNNQSVEKKIVIYLGRLLGDRQIQLAEHRSYEWFRWAPPHVFEEKTIAGVLKELETYFTKTANAAANTVASTTVNATVSATVSTTASVIANTAPPAAPGR